MNNNFIVSSCRFHTKEKNKLLIVGYFDENLIGKNRIFVKLDQQDVTFEIEEKERMLANVTSATGKLISKDYFIWVTLPLNFPNT